MEALAVYALPTMNALITFVITCCALTISANHTTETNPCQDKPNGYTIPASDITSDFYLCVNKMGIKLTCGTKYFNPNTHACELSLDRAHMCDGRANGDLIASMDNCSEYFVCIGKVALTRTCGWMHFNAITGKCVDFRFSNCNRDTLAVKSRPVVKYMPAENSMMVPVLFS